MAHNREIDEHAENHAMMSNSILFWKQSVATISFSALPLRFVWFLK